ncbi:MAG: InlB B-repeat-containing protein [Clostridiales bacterium]|jgi:hypothetical protein|nr:InlB B-repeat-containing protein [Clostridiales bacterium]
MGTTLAMFYDGRLSVKTFDTAANYVGDYKAPKDDPVIASLINYYHLSQYHPDWGKLEAAWLQDVYNGGWVPKKIIQELIDQTNGEQWNYVAIPLDGSAHFIMPHTKTECTDFYKDPGKVYWRIEVLESNSKPDNLSYLYINKEDPSQIWFETQSNTKAYVNLSYLLSQDETNEFFEKINLQDKLDRNSMNAPLQNYNAGLRMTENKQQENSLSMSLNGWKTMFSNYDSFSISDGIHTVSVINGEADSNEIQIYRSIIGDGPNKFFIYGDVSEYTITPIDSGLNDYQTSVLFQSDNNGGYLLHAVTGDPVPILLHSNAGIEIKSEKPTQAELSSTLDNFNAPWHTMSVKADSQANLLLIPASNSEFSISTQDDSINEIQVSGIQDDNVYTITYRGGVTELFVSEHENSIALKSTDNNTVYEKAPITYTVDFYTNVGGIVPSIHGLMPDDRISEPDNPSMAGYVFSGWYTQPLGFGQLWNFETDTIILDSENF